MAANHNTVSWGESWGSWVPDLAVPCVHLEWVGTLLVCPPPTLPYSYAKALRSSYCSGRLLNGLSQGQPGSGELSAGLGPWVPTSFAAHSLISLWFPKASGFLRARQDPHSSFMGPWAQSAGSLFAQMHFCSGCQPNCAPRHLVYLPQLQAL